MPAIPNTVPCDPNVGCATVRELKVGMHDVTERVVNLELEDKKLHDRITAQLQRSLDRIPAQTQTALLFVMQLLTLAAMILIAIFRH